MTIDTTHLDHAQARIQAIADAHGHTLTWYASVHWHDYDLGGVRPRPRTRYRTNGTLHAMCIHCIGQARVFSDTKEAPELAKPCRIWCAACDLITLDDVDQHCSGHLGWFDADANWFCVRCAIARKFIAAPAV